MTAALAIPSRTSAAPTGRRLQRKCACGKPTTAGVECEECRKKRDPQLQRSPTPVPRSEWTAPLAPDPVGPHLPIGRVDDPLEREAERVAAAVVDGSSLPLTSRSGPRKVQRDAGIIPAPELNVGDTQAARERRLPGHQVRSPQIAPRLPSDPAATGAKPCFSGDVCRSPVRGSAWDFAHRSQELQSANTTARKKNPGMQRERGSPRIATELETFVAQNTPVHLTGIQNLVVNPDLEGTGAGGQLNTCEILGNTPANQAARCIEVPHPMEAEAAEFNTRPDAETIGGVSRRTWQFNVRRMLVHELGHLRFENTPPAGLQTQGEISEFELNELAAQLSEMPTGGEFIVGEEPTPEARQERLSRAIRRYVEKPGEGIRGILTKLRCVNPCASVNADVRKVWEEYSAGWAPWLRDAVLAGLSDPNLNLGWPVPPPPRLSPASGEPGTHPEGDITLTPGTPLRREAATNDPAPATAPPVVHDVLRSSGQPLDPATRGFMEERFGHDFSGVRLHTDGPSAESAQAVGARAYTVGRDVVFGPGQFQPASSAGRQLLAHELAHVVQQNSGSFAPTVQRARWGSCPSGPRLDARNPFLYAPAELMAVGFYLAQRPTHCLLTNEMLAMGTVPQCANPVEQQMANDIIHQFHRDNTPRRRRAVESADGVSERAEGLGTAMEAATLLIQTALQPDIVDITAREVYDITTSGQRDQKRSKIAQSYVPRLSALTGRSWDAGDSLSRPVPYTFRVLPTETRICFGPTDLSRWPGVIQYEAIGKKTKGKKQKPKKKPKKKPGKKPPGTKGGNFGFGIGLLSTGGGSANAGVGVSVLSNGVAYGTVSGGVVFNSDGVAIGTVSAGAGANNSGGAAASASAGAGANNFGGSLASATAGVSSGGEGVSIAEAHAGSGGEVADAGTGIPGGVAGGTGPASGSEPGDGGAGSDRAGTTGESAGGAGDGGNARPGGQDGGTGPGEGGRQTAADGGTVAGDGNSSAATQRAEGGPAVPPWFDVPGVPAAEVNAAVQDAARLDAMIQAANRSKQEFLKSLARRSGDQQFLVPGPVWLETMLLVLEGLTDEEIAYLATLDWNPARIPVEELRRRVQEALARRHNPPPPQSPPPPPPAAPPATPTHAEPASPATGGGEPESSTGATPSAAPGRRRRGGTVSPLAGTTLSQLLAALDAVDWGSIGLGDYRLGSGRAPILFFGRTDKGTRIGAFVTTGPLVQAGQTIQVITHATSVVTLDVVPAGDAIEVIYADGRSRITFFAEGNPARTDVTDGEVLYHLRINDTEVAP